MRPFAARARCKKATLTDVGAHERSQGRSVAITLALLGSSLVALRLGGFILFDDRSGRGTDTSGVLLVAAAVLAVGAFRTGLGDPIARRALGGALAVLDVALVAIGANDDGFRFFWTTYEGELLQFEIALGLVALVLIMTSYGARSVTTDGAAGSGPMTPTGQRFTAPVRASFYACGLVAGMFVAFAIGIAHFEATECSGPEFDGECDLAALGGVVWAAGAFVLGLIVIAAIEVVGGIRRHTDRRGQDAVRPGAHGSGQHD